MRSGSVDLIVRGGMIVTPEGVEQGDLLVQGGRIVGWTSAWQGAAVRTVDARGLHVLPGMVDTHVHLMEPGDTTRETFLEGTAAAAAGGVTSIIEHTHGWPVHQLSRLLEKTALLQGRSYVDFGLAAHVWPDRLGELPALWGAGISFFKIFTCTTHGVPGLDSSQLLEVLGRLASIGAPALVHCEDERVTAEAERVLRLAGRMDPGVLNEWRTRDAELLAVTLVAASAWLTRAQVRVAHASNSTVIQLVKAARRSGALLSAETCPQYLLLRADEVMREGALRKFTPPARARSLADELAMWRCVEDGSVDQLSSDHAPSTREQKLAADIWEAPFGLPGLDTTSALLLDACVSGRTRPETVARVYADNPARYFGLRGKGRIAPGFDADLALVDLDATWTLTDEHVRSHAGWTPYAGRKLRGRMMATFLRGEVVYNAETGLAPEPAGRFLPGPGAPARPAP